MYTQSQIQTPSCQCFGDQLLTLKLKCTLTPFTAIYDCERWYLSKYKKLTSTHEKKGKKIILTKLIKISNNVQSINIIPIKIIASILIVIYKSIMIHLILQ